jgi:beta-lactamase regulating signal transducer with metallopeptidase domain/protocatechuate 3,4-dioxygenase beta subunit
MTGGPSAPALDVFRTLATLALLVWALGSVYFVLRLAHGCWRMRRLWRRLRPLDAEHWANELTAVARALSIARLPRLCVSPDVRSPLVAGLFSPCVVLPERLFEHSTPCQVRDVLLHECAHVVRHDPWVRLLQRLAVVLFWVHPLIYLLNRRLDHAREEICDNHVLAHTDAAEYAETLLTVAQLCYPVPRLEGYLTMMPRHHNLERRVAEMLVESRDKTIRLPISQRLAVLISFLLLLLTVSSVGLSGAASAEDPKGKAAPAASKDPPERNAQRPTTPPDKRAETGKVTGRVINDADGRPVAGAVVYLLPHQPRYIGDLPTRRTKTNEKGEFSYDAVAPKLYYVWAFHGNLASRSRQLSGKKVVVKQDGSSQPLLLRMRPGIAVRVKVLSQADGKPLPGARVRLIWTDTERDHFTNPRGEVELLALTAEIWHVEAAAKDHAAEVRVLNLENGQAAALEFKLAPGVAVQGRVRDVDGRPLAGVGVDAYYGDKGGPHLNYVETDAEGRYRLDYLPFGRIPLLLHKSDYLHEWKEISLNAGQGREARLDVSLRKRPHGGSVEGIVTDDQGKPIAGAEVANGGGSTDQVRRAKTDRQGKFLLDNVYEGPTGHDLVVRAKGFAPQRVAFTPGPATRPAQVAVRLEPGHRIKGRVVNEAGKPIRGVHVYFAHGIFPIEGALGGSGLTDAQGRFEFDSLPEKSPFTFEKDGYSAIPQLEFALDGDQEVVVTMKSQGVIKGRVVDAATGKPVPRFTVRATFSADAQPNEPSTGLSNELFHGQEFASAQGRFLLKQLLVGMPLQVSVSAAGYRREVVRRVVAEPVSEAETVAVQLKAEDPAKLVTLRGRLVNHRGDSVSGAELRLLVATDRPEPRDANPFDWNGFQTGQIDHRPNVLQLQRKTTAADGSFVFERVPGDAEIELVYWGKGVPGGRVDHLEKLSEKERTSLVVRAPASARIVGTIDRKAFPELKSIHLQLSGSTRTFEVALAADGKSLVIDDLPAGEYQILVFGPPVRVEGQLGALVQTLGRKSISLAEGQEGKVVLGEADRQTPTPPNP